jgi:hypothetical protein
MVLLNLFIQKTYHICSFSFVYNDILEKFENIVTKNSLAINDYISK